MERMKTLLIADIPMTVEEIKKRIKNRTNYTAKIIRDADTIVGTRDAVLIGIERPVEILEVTKLFTKSEKMYQVSVTTFKKYIEN